MFTQSRKSEATLTTRFPVSDFLTKKERCYAGAFQKQASLIPEAIVYYRRLKNAAPHLNVTVLVDPSDNNTPTSYEKMVGLAEIIEDYNALFNQT